NPAVTVGLVVARRFPARDAAAYRRADLAATAAATVLFLVASDRPDFSAHASGFAANGYGAHSPGHYGLLACLVVELVLTGLFLLVIIGATDERATTQFAAIAIGLALTLIHLVSIPVTNTSVNPARSIGVAFYAGAWALGQLWLFILAPVTGAALAGASYRALIPTSGELIVAPEDHWWPLNKAYGAGPGTQRPAGRVRRVGGCGACRGRYPMSVVTTPAIEESQRITATGHLA
ncbi:MAG: aquaporin, partial [Pseudonocardia sp.]|nr:aquaporin [Pseudonocardia sp.]